MTQRLSSYVKRLVHLPVIVLTLAGNCGGAIDGTALAAGGQALLPVIVGPQATDRVRSAATTLTDYLGRISGAGFDVVDGDGATGIVVGLPGDLENCPVTPDFTGEPYGHETYVLKSGAKAVWLLGATDLAVEHAVWDLLYRLGHRQFFPGNVWEIIPRTQDLSISIDVTERPDFCARRIWYNWGMNWGYNSEPYKNWCARNRAVRGLVVESGHAYEWIIASRPEVFKAHPEYLALRDGRRGGQKFCISNKSLRRFVADLCVERIRSNPQLESVSMDPSDGGGWCQCDACAAIGTPSDQALTLANEVAIAINELGLGTKYVGMYAYNKHCAPPSIEVHPNVVVSATTAFITGGWTFDRIVDGWRARGATIGVYNYLSVIAWDWNMPRRARAARPAHVAAEIKKFYGQGARFYDAESGDAWGPYGLGFYVAARAMWDIGAADRVPAIVDDFLTRAFGPAKEPMSKFYHLITVDSERRSMTDILGRMYRHLSAARKLAADAPDVRRRIDDLIKYTHYAEMYNAFSWARGDERAKARDAVVTYAYRVRKTMMVHAYGFWARTVGQDAAHTDDHPLKNGAPVTEQEVLTFLERGIAGNTPVDRGFEPLEFSNELVPAARALSFPEMATGSYPTVPQDRHTYYVWIDAAPAVVELQVTTEHVWDLRPHKIGLFAMKEPTGTAVAESDIVRPDGKRYDVALKTSYTGLHRLEVVDGGDYTRIVWPGQLPVTLPGGIDAPAPSSHFRGEWSMYIYVPKGTRTIGGWADRVADWAPAISGRLLDGDGRLAKDFAGMAAGWFNVPVPEGQDGRVWQFDRTHGQRYLMTVPAYFAVSPEKLLLPREVVESDRD